MKKNLCLSLGVAFLVFNHLTSVRAELLEHWTTTQVTTNQYHIDSIAYGKGYFVASGSWWDIGTILFSADGVHWTSANLPGYIYFGTSVKYANDRFVGVSAGYGSVAISTNGTDWATSYLTSPYSGIHNDITYGNGRYVLVGASIASSSDGISWSSATINPSAGGELSSVAYGWIGQPYFIAIGNKDGAVYTSTTGTSWQRRSIAGGDQVYFGNGLFIVPLNNTSNLVSSNGRNWSMQKTGLSFPLSGIVYANGLFWGKSNFQLSTSTDGTNWVQYPKQWNAAFATDGARIATYWSVPTTNSTMYNGFIDLSDPLVDIAVTNSMSGAMVLFGLVGRNYQIQSTDALGVSNNWRTNTSLSLTNITYQWTDTNPPASGRFYRGVLMP